MTAATHSQSSACVGGHAPPPLDIEERERYRRERVAQLTRENEFLHAERRRHERLLAVVLEIAVVGRSCSPLQLLEVVAASTGDDLGRAALVVERERSVQA